MSDAFEEIQAIKIKRNSYREKLQKRKRERHELYTLTSTPVSSTLTADSACPGIENYNYTFVRERIYSQFYYIHLLQIPMHLLALIIVNMRETYFASYMNPCQIYR